MGYVGFSADYRLHPEVRFPAFVHDGARAVHRLEVEAVAGEVGDATAQGVALHGDFAEGLLLGRRREAHQEERDDDERGAQERRHRRTCGRR